MKNIFKYSLVLLSAVMSLALTSCVSEDDYASAEQVKGMQVFFPQTSASFTPSVDNFYVVTVMRVDTTEEAIVPLTVTAPEDCHYKVPETVKFEAGQDSADIVVLYDVTTIEPGKYESVTIAVGDASYSTPYGASQFTFKAGIAPFEKVEGKKIRYRDDIICSAYGMPAIEYELPYEVNTDNPNLFRIYKPYACQEFSEAMYKAGLTESPEEALQYYIDEDDATDYMIVDASDPKHVYFYAETEDGSIRSGVTFNSSEGQMTFCSPAGLNIVGGASLDVVIANRPQWFGTFDEGVLTMPSTGVYLAFDILDGWYGANPKGKFRILMPGAKAEDFSTWFEYTGSYTSLDGKNEVMGNVHFGADVASALVTVVPAKAYANNDSILAAIDREEIPTQRVTTNGGRASFQVEGAGSYKALVCAYSKDGEMQEISDTTFKFTPLTGEAEPSWTPAFIGTMSYGVTMLESGKEPVFGQFDDENATLEALDGSDNTYRIVPFIDSEDGLVFTMDNKDANGMCTLHVPEASTGYVDANLGEVFVSDMVEYTGDEQYNDVLSYYDTNTGLFHFNLIYYCSKGYFAIQQDVYTPTANATRNLKRGAAKIKVRKPAKRAGGKKHFNKQRLTFRLANLQRTSF